MRCDASQPGKASPKWNYRGNNCSHSTQRYRRENLFAVHSPQPPPLSLAAIEQNKTSTQLPKIQHISVSGRHVPNHHSLSCFWSLVKMHFFVDGNFACGLLPEVPSTSGGRTGELQERRVYGRKLESLSIDLQQRCMDKSWSIDWSRSICATEIRCLARISHTVISIGEPAALA